MEIVTFAKNNVPLKKQRFALFSFGCGYSPMNDCNNHSWREDENFVKRLGKMLKVRTSEEKER